MGDKGGPDKPGLAEVIQLYKDNFGDQWQAVFEATVEVHLNYEYKEQS